MTMQQRFSGSSAEMAATALGDFASPQSGTASNVTRANLVDITPAPHRPKGLPIGRMAAYCFFLNGQALKIGIAGPKSDARFRSHQYGEQM
jgi:hypothetical protein